MLYEFYALDQNGQHVTAVVEAKNEDVLIEDLRARKYYPLGVNPAPKGITAITLDELPEPFSWDKIGFDEINKKMSELDNGNEAAYAELFPLLEKAFHYTNQHSGMIQITAALSLLNPIHDLLTQAGSPAAAMAMIHESHRQYAAEMAQAADGNIEALRKQACKAGRGWLSSVGSEYGRAEFKKVYGNLYIFGSIALMFHDVANRTAAVKLCSLSEIKSVAMAGFFRKKVRFRTATGSGWDFTLDWNKMNSRERSHIEHMVEDFRTITQPPNKLG